MTTPYTPEWQGHAGIQYSIPLGSWGSVTPRLDADMRTQIWTSAVNGPLNHIGGYTLYNARITWKPDQGNWEASLLALNLTDHFYYLNKFDLTGAGAGSVTGEPGRAVGGRDRDQAQVLTRPRPPQAPRAQPARGFFIGYSKYATVRNSMLRRMPASG